jgi:hypothetical protein
MSKSTVNLSVAISSCETNFSPVHTIGPRQVAILNLIDSFRNKTSTARQVMSFFDISASQFGACVVALRERGLVTTKGGSFRVGSTVTMTDSGRALARRIRQLNSDVGFGVSAAGVAARRDTARNR